MLLNLNPVHPTVRLDGEIIHFESLVLEQSMNSCHRFEVVCEFLSQHEMWRQTPQNLMNRIGARTTIVFEHRDSGTPYEFFGWVTDVRTDSHVHFIGEGDVVKLDGTRGMDSFVDCQLATIVSQSTQNVDIPVDCNPDFNGVIPYMMRYQESVFGFLNRLSSTYNEMFFYDGKTLHFGQPKKSSEVTLFYDHDIFCLTTKAKVVPHHVAAYDYIHDGDAEVYAEGANINGEVNSAGSVKIGRSTVIIGNIFATSAVIAGAVKGDRLGDQRSEFGVSENGHKAPAAV